MMLWFVLTMLGCGQLPPPQPLPAPSVSGVMLDESLSQSRRRAFDRLLSVNRALETWTPDPANADPDAAPRLRQLAEELRDAAEFTLSEERLVAERKFDSDNRLREFLEVLYLEAHEFLSLAEDVMRADPPATSACRTEIKGEPESATLHYMTYGEYADQKSQEWMSYELGSPLDIGLYQFRVSPPGEVEYFEKVLIASDPFTRTLRRVK